MDKTAQTTTKQSIRARLLAEHAQATREREARERRNLTHLVAFVAAEAKIADVDQWLADKIAKATREADNRRARHRETAAKALLALQNEGETVATIAARTGAPRVKVNEYLAMAGNGHLRHDLAAEEPAETAVPTSFSPPELGVSGELATTTKAAL